MEGKSELLNRIMNTIDVGMVFVDADNKLAFFSRAAGELLNVEPEERIGTSVFLCHPKELVQQVQQRIDDIRKDPQRRTKGRIVNYQGRYLHETFYSVSDEKGVYLGIAGVFQDVGEKVSLLKQLGKFEEPRVFGVGEMAPRKPNYLSACKA